MDDRADKLTEAVQAILRDIVNELEGTRAGLVALTEKIENKFGGTSLTDATVSLSRAKKAIAGTYEDIRAKIDALPEVLPDSGRKNSKS